MSIWMRAQQLPGDQMQKIRGIYSELFPIEVRHYLAPWIENKICPGIMEDQQTMFVEELVQEIQNQATEMTTPDKFVTKMKLDEAAKNIHMQFSHRPKELYAYLHNCLASELEVIQGCTTVDPSYSGQFNQNERKYADLLNGLQSVRQSVTIANEEIRNLQANIECFSLHYHNCVKNRSHLNFMQQPGQPQTNDRREIEARLRIEIDNQQTKLSSMAVQINHTQLAIAERMNENITTLRDLQSQVLDVQLIRWKREQQLSGNGEPMQSCLNTIQEWCESLAELIWATRQQVINVARINTKTMELYREMQSANLMEMLEEMSKQVTSILSTLVTSTFVIEKQPPQVMKTNTRFTATVRLLVGGQLNIHMNPPRVKVMIISEQQAQQLLKSEPSRKQEPVECGDILNNTGTMEYQPATKQLSVSFRNMQLRKIKRAEKKGTESVMDEKLTLLFQSEFKVGSELGFQVWTLSLPVVVIVHGNQEPHGWATVTWDNAFSPQGRVPFTVPDKVSWPQLADTLRIKFKSATGGSLTDGNMQFLAEKIFKPTHPLTALELGSMTVSWTQFCKDALPERSFTFWEWFYMVVKVTKDFLKTLWCDGLIMGFIQKKQAEDMLSKCPPGTFLLRFSDSELGGITIAWVGDGSEVFSLQPFTSRDLSLRCLADRVLDLSQLQYLYPNIPKNKVFSKYYTKPENEVLKNGYVKPVLITTLPSYMSNAYALSPDSQRNSPSVQSSYAASFAPSVMDTLDSNFMENDFFEQMNAYDENNPIDGLEFYNAAVNAMGKM